MAALGQGLQRERSLKARVGRQGLTGRTMHVETSAQQEMHRVWIKTEEVISDQREEKH